MNEKYERKITMNVPVKTLLVSVLMSSLGGCMSVSNDTRLCADQSGEFYTCHDLSVAPERQIIIDDSLYSAPLNFQLLGDYTEQMAAEIQQDLKGKVIDDTIVVSSFVHLESNLRSSSRLGNQLAESFIQALQDIDLPVSEHRLAEDMSIHAAGTFVLMRSGKSVALDSDAGYVLVGTLVKNHLGLVVNTRLVNIDSHKVEAASSRLLPNAIFKNI